MVVLREYQRNPVRVILPSGAILANHNTLIALIGLIALALVVSHRYHSRTWPGRPGHQYQRAISVGVMGLRLTVAGAIGWDLSYVRGFFRGTKWIDGPSESRRHTYAWRSRRSRTGTAWDPEGPVDRGSRRSKSPARRRGPSRPSLQSDPAPVPHSAAAEGSNAEPDRPWPQRNRPGSAQPGIRRARVQASGPDRVILGTVAYLESFQPADRSTMSGGES
jgi:hypothetical protein